MFSLARIFLALGAVASVAASPMSTALEARQNREIQIQSVKLSGEACSLGKTASVQLLADKRTFTVIYDKFVIRAGPGTTDKDYQKLCELRVKFTHASGYAFNVFNSEQRGFANLKKGDKADIDIVFGYSEEHQEVSPPAAWGEQTLPVHTAIAALADKGALGEPEVEDHRSAGPGLPQVGQLYRIDHQLVAVRDVWGDHHHHRSHPGRAGSQGQLSDHGKDDRRPSRTSRLQLTCQTA